MNRFRDRTEAGRMLGHALRAYRGRSDVLVLALPRGGVPVAREVAAILGAPLDVLVVRKLGMPGSPEYAIGAIASGGTVVLSRNSRLVSEGALRALISREQAELERREREYRQGPFPQVRDRTVIVVDDGLATGATMRAAVRALREMQAGQVVVAVPIAPAAEVARMRDEADAVVCLLTPAHLWSVGVWYEDFRQVTDAEVQLTTRPLRGLGT